MKSALEGDSPHRKQKKEKHSKSDRKKRKEETKRPRKKKEGTRTNGVKRPKRRFEDGAFWNSVAAGEGVMEADMWHPLAIQWAAMSKMASEQEVPIYANAEEAMRCLPERFSAFEKAAFPTNPRERCAALAAIAEIIADTFSKKDDNSMFFHFLRSLELALLERGEHLPDLAEDVAPRLRVKPLVTKTATVPAPLPVEWLEQEQQSGSKQGKPRSQKQAPPPPPQGQVTVPPMESAKPQADTDKDNAAADSSSSASEGDTETAEAKAAQRKVDAAALDAVYELCAAQRERPCHMDGLLHAENFRQFVHDMLRIATQPRHWEEAWRRTSFPQDLRPEATRSFLQCSMEFACAQSEAKDPAALVSASALGIAALSRSLLIKRQFVEEFFLEKMDDDPLVWEILSWLLFHWFPRNQTAGWGWWRVGWSWSEWWKVVERLLGKAQSFPQSALGMLKDAMIRMQEQKGCKRIFLKAPWDDHRRQNVIGKFSALMPELDSEEKVKVKLAPLRLWST